MKKEQHIYSTNQFFITYIRKLPWPGLSIVKKYEKCTTVTMGNPIKPAQRQALRITADNILSELPNDVTVSRKIVKFPKDSTGYEKIVTQIEKSFFDIFGFRSTNYKLIDVSFTKASVTKTSSHICFLGINIVSKVTILPHRNKKFVLKVKVGNTCGNNLPFIRSDFKSKFWRAISE